jgi:hypothetical protein
MSRIAAALEDIEALLPDPEIEYLEARDSALTAATRGVL